MQSSEKLVLTSALRVDAPAAEPEPEAPSALDLQQGGQEPVAQDWTSHTEAAPQDEMTSLFADVSEAGPPGAEAAPAPEANAHASLLARIQSGGVAVSPAMSVRESESQTPAVEADGAPPLGAFRRARMPQSDASEMTASDERWLDGVAQVPPEAPAHRGSPPASELAQSVEDATLEATLSRIEALLAGNPLPSSESEPPEDRTETENDTVIDETMLHQLVAHIVRQELQGELGEKITRNIRKLVRAEVARELALRKL
jgi:hypothetical protein